MRSSERGKSFFEALKMKRLVSGNCSRCGRVNPSGNTNKNKRGVCEICKIKLAEYRAKKRADRKNILLKNPASLTELYEELSKRVSILELYKKRMQTYAERRYLMGYKKGKETEKKENQNSRSEWEQMYGQRADMIGCYLDVRDKKTFSHVWQ